MKCTLITGPKDTSSLGLWILGIMLNITRRKYLEMQRNNDFWDYINTQTNTLIDTMILGNLEPEEK